MSLHGTFESISSLAPAEPPRFNCWPLASLPYLTVSLQATQCDRKQCLSTGQCMTRSSASPNCCKSVAQHTSETDVSVYFEHDIIHLSSLFGLCHRCLVPDTGLRPALVLDRNRSRSNTVRAKMIPLWPCESAPNPNHRLSWCFVVGHVGIGRWGQPTSTLICITPPRHTICGGSLSEKAKNNEHRDPSNILRLRHPG